MDLAGMIALGMGAAWASGINLYAALLMLGLMGSTGHMVLPPGMEVLQHPGVMLAAGFMYCVEFFADKVPGVDTGWDVLHTFVRIPAGAVLAATAIGDVSMAAQVAAGIIGGTLAGATHFTKAGSRVMINTSPEPVSNWAMSFAEDIAVVVGLWAALEHPEVFVLFLIAFVLAIAWLTPRIWRGIKGMAAVVRRRAGARATTAMPPPEQPPGLRLSLKSDPPDAG